MCFIDYISACRRLTESEKTVRMLSDDQCSEQGVPEMVLAQRDFIRKEKEYFEDQCVSRLILMFIIFIVGVFGYVAYFNFMR